MNINVWMNEHLSEVISRYYNKKIKCAQDHREHPEVYYECRDNVIKNKDEKLRKINSKLGEIFIYK